MPRDRIRQARTQHHEFVLPLALHSPNRAPHGVIQAPQLALRAGIHVAHPRNNHVSLIIQIQAIGDQFLELDVRLEVRPPHWTAAAPWTTTVISGTTLATGRPRVAAATLRAATRTTAWTRAT